jgi:hypothetical protein
VVASLSVGSCGTGNRAPVEPIYRYINVLDGTEIRLGERFQHQSLATLLDDTSYTLKPGTFGGGGTVSIVVRTDTASMVRSLTFIYDGSEPIDMKVAEYSSNLGHPAIQRDRQSGRATYIWENSTTRFELISSPGQVPALWSRLVDRPD